MLLTRNLESLALNIKQWKAAPQQQSKVVPPRSQSKVIPILVRPVIGADMAIAVWFHRFDTRFHSTA
ncbi:unnamed protein product [Taenia asiatica]|uniref:Uncharacterized protein n=1 Tax=Taenia asiatica TaxID=60517 RepID=A0A0R3W7M3_TAEAS|nr:unnamed protein product [Taenia asiatica]